MLKNAKEEAFPEKCKLCLSISVYITLAAMVNITVNSTVIGIL